MLPTPPDSAAQRGLGRCDSRYRRGAFGSLWVPAVKLSSGPLRTAGTLREGEVWRGGKLALRDINPAQLIYKGVVTENAHVRFM